MFDKFDKGLGHHTKDYDNILEFLPLIPLSQEDIKGKSLYLTVNCISQNKLRDSDFKIKRDKATADYIVIPNIKDNKLFTVYEYYSNENYKRIYPNKYYNELYPLFNDVLNDLKNNTGYKYVTEDQVYKYIYKYEGNLELFNQCKELFNSRTVINSQMAMEFISNANWEGNKIYLIELFNMYYDGWIKGSQYSYSISFKGFLNSLDFQYKYITLTRPYDYKQYCENDEHHQFVFDKYKDELESKLATIMVDYKIDFNSLQYSIDKSKEEIKSDDI